VGEVGEKMKKCKKKKKRNALWINVGVGEQ